MMPNKEQASKQIHKSRLIYNNKVLISWVEDLDAYKPPTDSTCMLNIVIFQLPSKLYLIKLIEKFDKNYGLQGPALDNIVVGPHILATVVRRTAINACKNFLEDRTKPFMVRKCLLDDFIQRNVVDQPIHHYFASQVST